MLEPGDDVSPTTNYAVSTGALIVLLVNLFYFGGLLHALYRVSPVLQARWSYVAGSLDVGSARGALLRVSFDVSVHNPTDRTAAWDEGAEVVLRHDSDAVSAIRLPAFEVEPGGTAVQTLSFELEGREGLVNKGLQLAKRIGKDGLKSALRRAGRSAVRARAYSADLVVALPTGSLTVPLLRRHD